MVYRKSLELLSLVLIVTGVAGAQSAGKGIPAIAKAANRAIVSIDAKRLLSQSQHGLSELPDERDVEKAYLVVACAKFATQIERDNPAVAPEQVTWHAHYSVKFKGCYVQASSHNSILGRHTDILYDGKTKEMLASAIDIIQVRGEHIYLESSGMISHVDLPPNCPSNSECAYGPAINFMAERTHDWLD